ncbi:DNA excision repair protein ERCC-6 [Phytophthora pseudosyringae]|uniref:DNA excision repair protein ERCC-6 n=1 Tax=Phytophthora pseudosyringae TaxID=221518 RepID=A0A8T1W1F5_9STRA|nr:DNA excision repair protein ERCC-6 [Phytophthora pseudosyringae]
MANYPFHDINMLAITRMVEIDGHSGRLYRVCCAFGSTRLLDRIWEKSDPEREKGSSWSPCQYLRSDLHYYRYQFTKSLLAAVKRADLDMVRWILAHFSRCTAGADAVEEAAFGGQMQMLLTLLNDTRNCVVRGRDDMARAIEGGHSDLARWLYWTLQRK